VGTGVLRTEERIQMVSQDAHRPEPTDEEKFAAAGAEDYLGVPISDEELADVWTSTPAAAAPTPTEDEPPA
jgi:hypothetical protein